MTIDDSLLSPQGYQLLSIAISSLIGYNREFDVSDKFEVFYSLCVEGNLWQ